MWGDQAEFLKYINTESISSTVVLTVLSVGLISAYFYLIYYIRKYYKGRMVLEMCRLKMLFAVFCVCYGLRAIYMYGEGSYRTVFVNRIVRLHFVNLLPLVWDIMSIVSILVMHHFTFMS